LGLMEEQNNALEFLAVLGTAALWISLTFLI